MELITIRELSELKEKFVRNRFAEQQYFGREDISDWLASQEENDSPDFEIWNRLFPLLHYKWTKVPLVDAKLKSISMLKLLREAGFRLADIEDFPEIKSVFVQKTHFKESFDYHAAFAELISPEVYLSERGMLVWSTNLKNFFRLDSGFGKGGTYCSEYQIQHIAEHLVAAWMYLPTHHARKERARAYLCDWLKRCIQKVRADAEAEFDQAVAVSRDGKNIVSADWVAVWEQVDHDAVYSVQVTPKEYYRDGKFVRSEKLKRLGEQVLTDDISTLDAQKIENLLSSIFLFSLDEVGKQFFLEFRNNSKRETCTCFVT